MNKINFPKLKFKILRTLLQTLQPFFPKDTYILYDNLYEKNAECIDTFCVFEYLQSRNIPSYYVLWKKNPLYQKLKTSGKLKNILVIKHSSHTERIYNFEFFFTVFPKLFRCKAVVTSFGGLNHKTNQFFYKNKYITSVHINHGATLLKTFVLKCGYLGADSFNKFLVSSAREGDIFQQYGWDKNNLVQIGLPRWDLLKKEQQPRKTVFLMFTWRNSFSTWNADKFTTPLNQTAYYRGIMSLLTNKALQNLLEKNNIQLYYSLHHSMLDQCRQMPQIHLPHLTLVPPAHISQYIGKADLFITDYSSLFFDFLFLHTPVIFYRPDFNDTSLLPSDLNDMEHAREQDPVLFNTCYDEEEVIRLLGSYIQNGFVLEPEKRAKAERLFSTRKELRKKFTEYLESL